MLALRLVLDTNVVISAMLRPDGMQRTALNLAITKPARLYVSQPILDEYASVLARPGFQIRRGRQLQMLQLIKNRATLNIPKVRIQASSDPDDDMFIECADAARADYLVTGNQKHFPKYWKATKVITTREFIELAAPHLLRR
ncbi:MAG: putative toxin-antitoxin system toxin component, PIN family [Terracidiphilus sp.]